MKTIISIAALALLAMAGAQAAQLYRWVDNKGNVEWRDTPPPPAAAKKVEERRVGGNVIETSDAPYSLQQAAKNHPVTLWGSSDCGKICEGARAHLARRGIPYADKEVKSDFDGFKKVSPGGEVPVLQVGVITLKGYLESEWDSTLDSAGYPRTAVVRAKPPASAPKPEPTSPTPKL